MTSPYGDCPRRKTLITILGSKHAMKNSQFYFWVPFLARNQEVLRSGEISWNMGTLTNVSCTTYKRRAPQGKLWVLFLQDAIKTAF